MPIILNNENENKELKSIFAENKKVISPHFFSKSLTGSGQSRGVLNGSLHVCIDKNSVVKPPIHYNGHKQTITTGTSTFEIIPMSLYVQDIYEFDELPNNAECISRDNITDENEKVYMTITMDYMILGNDFVNKTKSTYSSYDIGIIKKNKNEKYKMQVISSLYIDSNKISILEPNIDINKINNYIHDLKVYDVVIATAELWDEQIPTIMNAMLNVDTDTNIILNFCKMLNNYPINLTDYRKIYMSLKEKNPDALTAASKSNLNILMNEKLEILEKIKPEIKMFEPTTWKNTDIKFSPEQIYAITSTEPCCIVQAGAGTGKSTVINSRIKYLKQCGVDLSSVTVLSFTNAAANHIKDIAPDVRSQTIASMIHEIYSTNYSHNLSTPDTLSNIIQANSKLMKENPIAQKLIDAFKQCKSNINSGLLQLSDIAATNFNELINLLDTVNQTTLELQSIICYYASDKLIEHTTNCKHIIMDEVQDNSIFDFIYIMNYVIKHKASLYIVGDCSQTLYEFRASNPKALNCLEMSGIFKCMQLQTNYRSNQNILDFANLTLNSIEANQYAKIQLHANHFDTRPFDEDVKVSYTNLPNVKSLKEQLPSMIINIKDWILDKLNKGEQIAFLAYRRADLTNFEEVIKILLPQATFINIVPAKTYEQTFFSKYIRIMGNDYVHKTGSDATIEIMRHIIDNKEKIGVATDNQIAALKSSVVEWMNKYKAEIITKDMVLQKKMITRNDFTNYVFQTLIDFEIEKNALRLRITSMKNQNKKEQDISKFNFIASTIHSAKGLEFDNIILLYNESNANEEESKRMYYVGLTRAKNSECVLAYNVNKKSSNILDAYKLICEHKCQIIDDTILESDPLQKENIEEKKGA